MGEMKKIYTREDWSKDRIFSAVPGQEVTKDVYDEMFNCMPPRRLSAEAQEKACAEGLCVFSGFMMGEPHSCDRHGELYLAFGISTGTGKHYYIGIAH